MLKSVNFTVEEQKRKKRTMRKTNNHHYWALLPRPATAPPSLPNCRPSPDRGFGAGWVGAGGSLIGTGGPRPETSLPFLGSTVPSPMRRSLSPSDDASSASPPTLFSRRARSWTMRNFSRSSFHRIMPSSRPFNLLGRSKVEALGVVTLLWCDV